MKPTLLRPGRSYILDGRQMTFLRRHKAQCGQPAVNVFRCPSLAGLYGPADLGDCTVTDYRISRFCQKAP